jgi:hypothetical protein
VDLVRCHQKRPQTPTIRRERLLGRTVRTTLGEFTNTSAT